MITILVIIMILMICLTIYGGTYYAIMLNNIEKGEKKIIKKSGKCPECRVSCPSNPNCPECETCPTTTEAPTTTVAPTTIAPTTAAPVTTAAPSTTAAPVTTAAPSTTEEPKDENGVPMWAVNAGWPGDEKYLCRVPESCITLSRGSGASNHKSLTTRSSKSVCESPDVNIQMVTKWCGPIPKISTLIKEMEGKAFMGFSNKTYREMGGRSVQGRDHKKEYLRETSNGYDTAYPFKVVLKGWTHEDIRVYGYTRNSPGMATAKIVGLESGKKYDYRIIIHVKEERHGVARGAAALLKLMNKPYNYKVNGAHAPHLHKMEVIHVTKFGSTNIGGSAIANDKGEIEFQFHNTYGNNSRIGLSNILIGSPDSDIRSENNSKETVDKETLTEEEKYEKKLNELHKNLLAERIVQGSRTM